MNLPQLWESHKVQAPYVCVVPNMTAKNIMGSQMESKFRERGQKSQLVLIWSPTPNNVAGQLKFALPILSLYERKKGGKNTFLCPSFYLTNSIHYKHWQTTQPKRIWSKRNILQQKGATFTLPSLGYNGLSECLFQCHTMYDMFWYVDEYENITHYIGI